MGSEIDFPHWRCPLEPNGDTYFESHRGFVTIVNMKDVLSADRCATLLKALADDDRLRIVQLLRDGPLSVGELAQALGAEIANVSHHLQILRRHEFVQPQRIGRRMVYRLTPEFFQSTRRSPQHFDLGCCRIEIPER